MSTFGLRRSLMSMAALTATYFGGQRNVSSVPQEALKNRWDPRTNRFQQRTDMYYLSSAHKRASKSKNYPFSSTRQNERTHKKMITVAYNGRAYLNQRPSWLYLTQAEINYNLYGEK